MIVLTQRITGEQLFQLEEELFFDDIMKGVVDISKGLLAVNAELHSDLEALLLALGSNQKDLYGINILADTYETEFDSLINPPRNREAGFPRAGRTVADPAARKKIEEVINTWIDR